MLLFDDEPIQNILPFDGEVAYYGVIFSQEQIANYYKDLFINLAWKNDEAIVFGKHFITPRKVAWYGDKAYKYNYSNIEKAALPFTASLLEIREKISKTVNETFNSCLANLYENGSQGMAWHSDAEKALGDMPTIASITFGAERKFCFKHKATKEVVSIQLQAGSLLLMKGNTQQYWLHRLPPTTKVNSPRINLTFRNIY